MPRHSASQRPAWLRPRFVAAFAVAAAGLAVAIWLPTRNDNASAAERNWGGNRFETARAFADDFEGRRGSSVDLAKWLLLPDGFAPQSTTGFNQNAGFGQFSGANRSSGFGRTGGFSPGIGTSNARLDGDGNLVITARSGGTGGATSARLVTRDLLQATAGHVEARIKTPEGNGLRSTFQLLSMGRFGSGTVNLLTEPVADGFHTYAAEWTPDELVVSVDGRESQRIRLGNDDSDQPFRLSLGLGVSDGGRGTSAELPARMLVDSVSFAAEGASEAPTTPPATEPTTEPTDEPTTPPTDEPTSEPTSPPATTEPTAEPSSPPPATTEPTTPPTSAPPAADWEPFTDYLAGQLVSYDKVEYQVLETHTSLPGWEPPALPNLFRKL